MMDGTVLGTLLLFVVYKINFNTNNTFMKKEYKNLGYMLAWVVVATMLLNPTFASQISSNLVKGFVAITSSDIKAENNLVWLDAWWKLPIDVIPAAAETAGWETTFFVHQINYYSDRSYYTCPTWYVQVTWDWANRADAYGSLMSWWKGYGWRFWHMVDWVFKDWCRHNNWDHDGNDAYSENLRNQAYNDSSAKRCTMVTSCTKIY